MKGEERCGQFAKAGGLSSAQLNGVSRGVKREVSGNPGKGRTGQQINHNESTLILLSGCPKNGVHL